jgi:hypothetical protein
MIEAASEPFRSAAVTPKDVSGSIIAAASPAISQFAPTTRSDTYGR